MNNRIQKKTQEINERTEDVMAKAIANSGMSLFTSNSPEEVGLFRECLILMKDVEQLMLDYAEALDKISDLENKIDILTDLIKKSKDK